MVIAVVDRGLRPEVPAPSALPSPPLRQHDAYVALMRRCWASDPAQRPGFDAIISDLRCGAAPRGPGPARCAGLPVPGDAWDPTPGACAHVHPEAQCAHTHARMQARARGVARALRCCEPVPERLCSQRGGRAAQRRHFGRARGVGRAPGVRAGWARPACGTEAWRGGVQGDC